MTFDEIHGKVTRGCSDRDRILLKLLPAGLLRSYYEAGKTVHETAFLTSKPRNVVPMPGPEYAEPNIQIGETGL